MRRFTSALMILLCLAACERRAPGAAQRETGPRTPAPTVSGWRAAADAEGPAIGFFDGGHPQIRIICGGEARVTVNLPGLAPIGSEERLSFGAGGEVLTLVVDTDGDKVRGGISGTGPIPDELKSWLIQPQSASYGRQTVGPIPAVPDRIAGPFLSKCATSLEQGRIAATVPKHGTSPCHVQEGRVLRMSPVRALGTEPFWNAVVDGRCVTYSTPEDPAGLRIWTRIGNGPAGPIFNGTYRGKPFTLIYVPSPNCSDGMSDKKYEFAAELTVGGEKRRGCAELR